MEVLKGRGSRRSEPWRSMEFYHHCFFVARLVLEMANIVDRERLGVYKGES